MPKFLIYGKARDLKDQERLIKNESISRDKITAICILKGD